MLVSTDAIIVDPNKRITNLVSNGGSVKEPLEVNVNGKIQKVQTRLNEDGSRALLATEKIDNVYFPVVLATVDPQGNTTLGGQGQSYNNTTKLAGNLKITTSEEAAAIFATGTIGGVSSTLEEQLSFSDSIALNMSKTRQSNRPNTVASNPNNFIPATRVGTQLDVAEPIVVIPHNATNVSEKNVAPGEADAENNDPNASNGDNIITQITEDPGAALGNAWEYIKKEAPRFFENMKLSDAEIALFEGMFEAGGGDTIQGAQYPIDNTFGQIRGQDYVTIDQFIYQPPRRNQILGDRRRDGENPIENIFQGSTRLTPLKKLVASVKLPMPNDITDSNAVSWGDDAMNNMSAALTSAVMRNPAAGLAGGLVSMLNPTLGKLTALAGAAMDNPGVDGDASFEGKLLAIRKMMEQQGIGVLSKTGMGSGVLGMMGVNVSPESILSRGFGVIPNSNTELLFNNVTLRDFQFSWRMSPRDEAEALVVKRIIRFFKQGMAAKTQKNQAGERSVYLGAPNVFRLQYRTEGGRIIEGVNRIKPCAVVGTAVNYTPDGQWSAYDEGQPVSCTLSIQMKELEPVYASDYSMNVVGSRRSGELSREQFVGPFADASAAVQDIPTGEQGDLYPIRPTEVGY